MIFPENSVIYQTLDRVVRTNRIVLFAGIPGTGKSLFVQQAVALAHRLQRRVHLLQWDVSRMAFETAEVIAKYPEIDGVTDPAIRKGVGLWSRQAVLDWHRQHPEADHILIGEAPLVGNRLVELGQKIDDPAESLLGSDVVQFVVCAPSKSVRAVIEEARAATIQAPRNAKEVKDAPPNVLQMNWQETYDAAADLGLAVPNGTAAYDPDVYVRLFQQVLTHRQVEIIRVNDVVQPTGSVYQMPEPEGELAALVPEVNRLIAQVEAAYTREKLIESVNQWYQGDA